MDRDVPLNEESARRRLAAIADLRIRNLVSAAFGAAFVQLLRPEGVSDSDWDSRLPAYPFDLDFFVKTLVIALGTYEITSRILAGESLDVVSGWRVEDESRHNE